ncbi:MAG: hypothetical protein DRI94_15035 [Bacteroidetes bacterium]|nr:MAG: hypothetical protein DRI94_15035 [Bacteroidota bacterium]
MLITYDNNLIINKLKFYSFFNNVFIILIKNIKNYFCKENQNINIEKNLNITSLFIIFSLNILTIH